MNRPVMDPMFLLDHRDAPRHPRLAATLARTGHALRWVGRKLISRPFRRRSAVAAFDDESPAGKILRGVFYRMLFVPVFLTAASAGAVYWGTHPRAAAAPAGPAAARDPSSAGVYYDPVHFAAADGTPLHGWLVPVVDARRVLLHKDRILRQRHPAVVLAHDFGRAPEQMLPLLAPLHEDGVVVVAVGLRGVGAAAGPARGQTFGLNEAGDVAAAVQMLRRRPFVDADRIGVLGVGTGANAALIAADRDPSIRAVVMIDPVAAPDEAIARHLGPNTFGARWLQPLNKWTFQLAYRVNFNDLTHAHATAAARPVLRLDRRTDGDGRIVPTAIEDARDFLRARLTPPPPAAAPVAAQEARPAVAGAGRE